MGSFIHTAKSFLDRVVAVDVNSTISIDGIDFEDEECVLINKHHKELYCIELVGKGNIAEYLSDSKINALFDTYKKSYNGYIITAYLKNKNYQRAYIFSNNKKILKLIARYLEARFLKYNEIINVIFDLLVDNKYPVKNKVQHRDINLDENIAYEDISHSFNKLVKDSIYKGYEDLELYQSYKFYPREDEGGRVDLIKLFSLDWQGVIFTYIDFRQSTANMLLDKKKVQAMRDGTTKDWTELKSKYSQGRITLGMANSMVLLKGDNADEMIIDISECLGIGYRRKSLNKREILKYTPLIARDSYWDSLIDKELLYGFIGTVHKENVEKPDFYGYDLMGNYWNYCFHQTTPRANNKNSNILMLGVSGSGKTTNTNGMLAQLLGLDIKTSTISNLDNEYIRDFDIKKSGFFFKEEIKKAIVNPHDLKETKASLNDFTYNPLNITTELRDGRLFIDQDELSMNILLMSIALESKSKIKGVGFDTSEQLQLVKLINEVYLTNEYDSGTLFSLKENGKKGLYQELKELGYQENTKLREIKEERYRYLNKPQLINVIKLISKKKNSEKNSVTKATLESLETKLNDLKEMGIFSGLDNFDINATIKYLYMDFDDIKDQDEYAPIFLALFTKIYREDKKRQQMLKMSGKKRPRITYKFEECKNIFAQPSFSLFLDKLNNEARSFGIRILFITQLIEHVPANIYSQIQNIMLLFPEKAKREALIDSIKEALKPSEEIINMFREKTQAFMFAIFNEHGCSVVRLPMSKKEIEIFGQSAE